MHSKRGDPGKILSSEAKSFERRVISARSRLHIAWRKFASRREDGFFLPRIESLSTPGRRSNKGPWVLGWDKRAMFDVQFHREPSVVSRRSPRVPPFFPPRFITGIQSSTTKSNRAPPQFRPLVESVVNYSVIFFLYIYICFVEGIIGDNWIFEAIIDCYMRIDACERIRESQVFLQYLLFPVVIKMNCYKNFLEFWNELFALPTFQRSFTEFGFLRILKISNLMNFLALQTFILLLSSFRSKLFMNFRNCESNDEVFVLRSLFLCFKKKKKKERKLAR